VRELLGLPRRPATASAPPQAAGGSAVDAEWMDEDD
jgi:hypothetical protein